MCHTNNMPKKIVIQVQIRCDKCRTKALKIAAGTDGVNSLAIQGADKDELVVTGDGIDSATLTCTLRKKVGSAKIISVQEEKAQVKADQPQQKKTDPPTEIIPLSYYCSPTYQEHLVVCDPNPNPCSIL